MPFSHVKTFEKDAIAHEATYSDSWVADKDYVIKRLMIARKNGTGLTASTIYFKIADRVYTREIAPAVYFGPDVEVTPVLNIPFKKGEKLDFTFKNLEGVAIDVYVYFEVEES